MYCLWKYKIGLLGYFHKKLLLIIFTSWILCDHLLDQILQVGYGC
uniref:Uncharacterized protein n=1 Tax=Arundo donax TaxID=35708 RepID=A0A0A8YMM1_ARUDO